MMHSGFLSRRPQSDDGASLLAADSRTQQQPSVTIGPKRNPQSDKRQRQRQRIRAFWLVIGVLSIAAAGAGIAMMAHLHLQPRDQATLVSCGLFIGLLAAVMAEYHRKR